MKTKQRNHVTLEDTADKMLSKTHKDTGLPRQLIVSNLIYRFLSSFQAELKVTSK